MPNLVARVRNALRARGVEVGWANLDSSLPAFLAHLLPRLRVTCVLDVGANRGQFGRQLRDHGYRGHIVSFEPVPAAYRALARRAARDPAWQAYPWALGAEEHVRPITVMRISELSSFRPLARTPDVAWAGRLGVRGREMVPVRRLDDVFDEVTRHVPDRRVYLKLDTQGWDLEVLAGARGCLPQIVALQSEMAVVPLYAAAPTVLEAIPFIRSLGYEVSGIFGVTRERNGRLIEVDCVMIRTPT